MKNSTIERPKQNSKRNQFNQHTKAKRGILHKIFLNTAIFLKATLLSRFLYALKLKVEEKKKSKRHSNNDDDDDDELVMEE